MTDVKDVMNDKNYKVYLDHGFVGLIDSMGSDTDICRAASTSYGNSRNKTEQQNRSLLRYMLRHGHTSPFEMAELKFHIKLPIFVMRQHVRHRTASLNEWSGRYTEMPNEFYIPDINRMCGQSEENKQQSGSRLDDSVSVKCLDEIEDACYHSFYSYEKTLSMGLVKELARIQLPVSTFTEIYWKIDLHNLMRYLSLRNDSHAQKEIQILAQMIEDLTRPLFPFTFEAYDNYIKNSIKFSYHELKLLKQLVSGKIDELTKHEDMTKREVSEFIEKMNKVNLM